MVNTEAAREEVPPVPPLTREQSRRVEDQSLPLATMGRQTPIGQLMMGVLGGLVVAAALEIGKIPNNVVRNTVWVVVPLTLAAVGWVHISERGRRWWWRAAAPVQWLTLIACALLGLMVIAMLVLWAAGKGTPTATLWRSIAVTTLFSVIGIRWAWRGTRRSRAAVAAVVDDVARTRHKYSYFVLGPADPADEILERLKALEHQLAQLAPTSTHLRWRDWWKARPR